MDSKLVNIPIGNSSALTVSKSLAFDISHAGGNYWTTKSSTNVARNSGGTFSINGFLYYAEGVLNPAQTWLSSNDRYNDQFDTWLIRSPSIRGFSGVSAFSLSLGYVGYGDSGSASGSDSSLVSYNEFSNSWLTKASGSIARRNVASSALNGFGYVFQGTVGSGPGTPQTANEKYDESLNMWSTKSATIFAADLSQGLNISGYMIGIGGRLGSNSSLTNTVTQYNDSSNSWITMIGTISVNKAASFSFTSGDIAFTAAGFISGAVPTNTTDRFDPIMKNWSAKALVPISIEGAPLGSTSLNNTGYVCNGYTSASVATNYQHRGNNLHKINEAMYQSSRVPRSISISTTVDGLPIDLPVQLQTDGTTNFRPMISNTDKILKTGETNLSSIFSTNALGIREYIVKVGMPLQVGSVAAGFWLSMANLNTGASTPSGLATNGNGYITGGLNVSALSVNQMYNDFLDSWLNVAGITARSNLAEFSLSGSGYIVGGLTTASASSASILVERYISEINSIISISSQPTALASQSGANLNGSGYAVGGFNTSGTSTQNNFKYDESSNSWLTKAIALTARNDVTAFSLNRVSYFSYGIGGVTRSSATEMYNDAADTWTNKSPTSGFSSRYGVSCFTISGRAILSTGNLAGNAATPVSEEYVDSLNTFLLRSDNPVSKFSSKGFSLNNKGYVCGGNSGNASVSKYSTEITIPKLIVTLKVEDTLT